MKKQFYTLVFIALAISTMVNAQVSKDEIRQMTAMAYLTKSQTLWTNALQKATAFRNENPTGTEGDYIYLNTLYGLIYSTIAGKDKETYSKYIDLAEKETEQLMEKNPGDARFVCIRAGLYSASMAHNPWKGMFYGPKSSELIEKAIGLKPDLPQCAVRKANSLYFTPENYGGDIKKSMEVYSKSIALFEAVDTQPANNWEYLDALAWYGISQMKNGKNEEAKTTFEKALRVRPDFHWVKNVLLPEALKKLQNTSPDTNKE